MGNPKGRAHPLLLYKGVPMGEIEQRYEIPMIGSRTSCIEKQKEVDATFRQFKRHCHQECIGVTWTSLVPLLIIDTDHV